MSSTKMLKTHWFYRCRPKKCLNKHWFYCIGQKTYLKSIGFIDRATEIIDKKRWFYKQRGRTKIENKNNGFIDRATEIVEKTMVL